MDCVRGYTKAGDGACSGCRHFSSIGCLRGLPYRSPRPTGPSMDEDFEMLMEKNSTLLRRLAA